MTQTVTDRFFEKYEVIVRVEIQSENLHFKIDPKLFDSKIKTWSLYDTILLSNQNFTFVDETKKLILVQKGSSDNCFQYEFNHKDMDGINFIQNIVDGFYLESILSLKANLFQKCITCIFPLLCPKMFYNHVRFSFINPFLSNPNQKIQCVRFCYSLHQIKQYYLKIKKEFIQDLKFSTFLCAIPCFLYYKKTNATFMKLQIVHYIPMMKAKNKIFPDNILLNLKSLHSSKKNKLNSFLFFLKKIHKKRHSSFEIYQIYQYYNAIGKYCKIPSKIIPVDVSFSTIPVPLEYDEFRFVSKSHQFEKCSMLGISNTNDILSLCFSIEENIISMLDEISSILPDVPLCKEF